MAGYASSEPGEYSIDGHRLTLAPYEYFDEPYKKAFALAMNGGSLTLTTAYETTQEYRLVEGSTADVLAREQVATTWLAAGRALSRRV